MAKPWEQQWQTQKGKPWERKFDAAPPAELSVEQKQKVLDDTIPTPADQAPKVEAKKRTWREQIADIAGNDPVLQQLLEIGKTTVKGAPEAAYTAATGFGSAVTAGLTQPLLHPTDPNLGDRIEGMIAANTHRPDATPDPETGEVSSAAKLLQGVGMIAEPMKNLKSVTLEPLAEQANKIPVIGNALATTIDKLPEGVLTVAGGPKLQGNFTARAAPKVTDVSQLTVPKNPGTDLARKAGMKVLPSDVQAAAPAAKVPGQKRQAMLSDSKTVNTVRLHNQKRSTEFAGEDLGTKKATQLGEPQFNALEAPHIAKYRSAESAVDKIGMGVELEKVYAVAKDSAKLEGQQGITRVIGALRRRAAKREQSDVVATEEAGFADRKLADSLEEAFGKRLEGMGEKELFTGYQAARQSLAKINDVRTATRSGQVDVEVLNKLKKKGVKLSGKLDMLADIAEAHPHSMKHSSSTAKGAPTDLSGTRHSIFSAVTAPLARAVPRLNVASDTFQKKFGQPLTPEALDEFAAQYRQSQAPAPLKPQSLYDEVPFQPTPGVSANPVNAQRMAGDLQLQRDPIAMGDIDMPAAPVAAPTEQRLAQALRTSRPPPAEQPDMFGAAPEQPIPFKLSSQPQIRRESGDVGDHYYKTDNAAATVRETGNYLEIQRIDSTVPGEGAQILRQALKDADANGQILSSGVSISADAVPLARAMAKRAKRELVENPSEPNGRGGLVSTDPRKPVFEIKPLTQEQKTRQQTAEALRR